MSKAASFSKIPNPIPIQMSWYLWPHLKIGRCQIISNFYSSFLRNLPINIGQNIFCIFVDRNTQYFAHIFIGKYLPKHGRGQIFSLLKFSSCPSEKYALSLRKLAEEYGVAKTQIKDIIKIKKGVKKECWRGCYLGTKNGSIRSQKHRQRFKSSIIGLESQK